MNCKNIARIDGELHPREHSAASAFLYQEVPVTKRASRPTQMMMICRMLKGLFQPAFLFDFCKPRPNFVVYVRFDCPAYIQIGVVQRATFGSALYIQISSLVRRPPTFAMTVTDAISSEYRPPATNFTQQPSSTR